MKKWTGQIGYFAVYYPISELLFHSFKRQIIEAMMNTTAQQAWPADDTPLFKVVQSPYFLPVTEEILAEIVRRIVEKLDPEGKGAI